jgi:UTP--glucose-1-phosphate uridylyltransferase
MELLGRQVSSARPGERIELSPALAKLASKERYLALEVEGIRYNIGVRYGLLFAQLALALDGADREEVLMQIVDLLAVRERTQPINAR